MLFYLTSQDPTETEWTACEPEPGSLFIVGDDKQSIYRFRRADMEVFASVGRLIDKSGGEAVTLTKNFRSWDVICDWCDAAFSDIFDDPALQDLQAPYTPFDPQRTTAGDTGGVRRLDIDKVRGNWGRDIAAADAEQIARYIDAAQSGALPARQDCEEAAAEGARYSDFLLLTRTKTRLSIYAEALAERGIPYTVTGSEDLGEAEELKALVDLLTCALRPDDPVAGVAYLKGPLVGASDDDLYRFREAGGVFDQMHAPLAPDVTSALPPETRRRFVGAFERLRTARTCLREERPSVAVERIVDTFGLLAGAAHPPAPTEGSLRAGRVLRTITLVQSLAAQGLGWAEVLDELERVVEGEEDVDGMTLDTGREDAVRVMNVHQAKGLEAPVVFLADPYARGSGPPTQHHLRRDAGELVAPIVQGRGYRATVTHPPLGWNAPVAGQEEGFRAREERHAAAEERRLLYVAATRAEKQLVVSTYPAKPTDGPWAPLYPHLDAADAPALPVPAAEGEAQPGPDATAPAPALEAHRDRRRAQVDAAARPSYRTETVTGAAPEPSAPALSPEPGHDGYGEAFGTALHALLEQVVQARHQGAPPPDEATLRAALAQQGADPSTTAVSRLDQMIQRFLGSPLWREIQSADAVFTEYPLAHVDRGASPVCLSRGVADLVYRGAAGWGVIDYKSDRCTPPLPSRLPSTHPYAQQVQTYVRGLRAAMEAPLHRAGVWFADAGTLVSIPT